MLTTPLIAHLARSGTVDVLTTPAAAPLLAGHPSIRRVIPFDKRGAERGASGIFRVAALVRSGHTQATAYLAQGSWRSASLAVAGGYRDRVGFDTSAGKWLYTRRITHRPEQHHAERLLRLAVGNDAPIAPDALAPSLFPSTQDRETVDELIVDHGARYDRLIALAPGSVWATKRWPRFPELARALAPHGRLVIVGGAADRELANSIRTAVPEAIDTTGRLGLLASADLIRRSKLLVTNDSLPQHLASAMGTPTVTIYGPTIPAFGFGPLAPRSTTAGHEFLDCRPCHPHGPAECPLGHHRCMRDLAAADVLSRALAVLHA